MNKYEINSNLDHPVDWSKLTIESSSSIPYIDNLGYRSIFNFINRKNSGSVLLSGERGAGKTTAVFHAIKKSLPILES